MDDFWVFCIMLLVSVTVGLLVGYYAYKRWCRAELERNGVSLSEDAFFNSEITEDHAALQAYLDKVYSSRASLIKNYADRQYVQGERNACGILYPHITSLKHRATYSEIFRLVKVCKILDVRICLFENKYWKVVHGALKKAGAYEHNVIDPKRLFGVLIPLFVTITHLVMVFLLVVITLPSLAFFKSIPPMRTVCVEAKRMFLSMFM